MVIYSTKNDCSIYKQCRINKGLTQSAVAKLLNIDRSTISKWESGVAIPDQSILPKIADLYNVSVDYLLGRSPALPVNAYQPNALVKFSVIGSIKAGYDGQVEEFSTGEQISLPLEMLAGRPADDYLVFQVRGNSMYPKLLDGDKVLVLRTDSVDSGTTAVIAYGDDEATIKKVVYREGENWLDLIPANPEYETKHISGADLEFCRIIGKAVKLIRDI